MSRIGKSPITVPSGVEVKVEKGLVTVKGTKGELTQNIDTAITVEVEGSTVNVLRHTEQKAHKAKHGLYRSLISNMIEGVSNGFKVQQELVGVGYRANVQGQRLDLMVGYSHNIILEIPKEVKVSAEAERGKNPIITLESHDKQLIGHVAAKIRSLRKPEPYKGKGIKFVGEILRRKAGKSAAKK
ncbi:MAG: 50S ribosomal protein L6 [Flavobacteriales bacterium CG18_big_fil_WC_8_21_14_2_50_32_9]|nr:MAG: 50S ribosomal protein L6 [Flavobacteriales bacterium CG18_big_fil_WC_8_21_14_2_50_32_9]PJC62519.1 MAG: 50S ribosomal protein L6 [Flavobacteriales bacterium CG_4_9_14_0_2_um_filter_32_27]